jgi:glutaredoxin-like YruB-family protein
VPSSETAKTPATTRPAPASTRSSKPTAPCASFRVSRKYPRRSDRRPSASTPNRSAARARANASVACRAAARRRQVPGAGAFRGGGHEVVVYTTSWCGWCKKTLAWLDAKGVDYENRDVETNAEWAEERHDLTGSGGVPVIVIDGEVIKGFDQAQLDEMLRG